MFQKYFRETKKRILKTKVHKKEHKSSLINYNYSEKSHQFLIL